MWASLVAQLVKNLPAVQETQVQSLGWEDPLEKEMAPHSSFLAWKISWTEEPGGLQSMGSQRVRHNWVTNTYSKNVSLILQGPVQELLLELPMPSQQAFLRAPRIPCVHSYSCTRWCFFFCFFFLPLSLSLHQDTADTLILRVRMLRAVLCSACLYIPGFKKRESLALWYMLSWSAAVVCLFSVSAPPQLQLILL